MATHALRRDLAERAVGSEPAEAPAVAAPAPQFYDALFEAVSRDAAAHVVAQHGGDSRPDAELERLLGRARTVVDTVRAGLTPPEELAWGKARPWRHVARPQAAVWSRTAPYLDRARIEDAVAIYLALPFRSLWLDRLLVDLLVAAQLFSFGEAAGEVVKSGTPRQWLHGRLYSFAFWTIVALTALTLYRWGWISAVPAAAAGASAALLFVLETALAIPALRRQALRFEAIRAAYRPLGSPAALDTRAYAEPIAAAASAGVRWSQPLYRLLQDIHRRGGRF